MLLEDEEGSPVQVSATDLAAALGGVNMVVLAGCHAAVGGENLPGLALDLVAAGIPAVVAMAGWPGPPGGPGQPHAQMLPVSRDHPAPLQLPLSVSRYSNVS